LVVCGKDPYSGKRIYGPYIRKDGRQHIVVYDGITRKTVSYPKYLMEVSLGRVLDPVQETIDHIDGNWMNNDASNLRIVPLKQHAKDDAKHILLSDVSCVLCGKLVPSERLRWAHLNRNRVKQITHAGPFCSKQCAGKYGTDIQKGRKKLSFVEIAVEYARFKDINTD